MSLDPTRDYILMTLEKDSAKTADEAYKAIYKKIRRVTWLLLKMQSIDSINVLRLQKVRHGTCCKIQDEPKIRIKDSNEKKFHTFQVEDFILILKHLIKLNNKEALPDDMITYLTDVFVRLERWFRINSVLVF